MNLILLFEHDYIDEQTVCLQGRRLQHVTDVHRAQLGDSLRVGDLNGKVGRGVITCLTSEKLVMTVCCRQSPPQPVDLILVLALPRPKVLKRTLLTATTLGLKYIALINSWRVDKSYWGSPALTQNKVDEQLILGLEQCCDTRLPEVSMYKGFKPFVEDRLPELMAGRQGYVAHPESECCCPERPGGPLLLVVGPEGGFNPYEIAKLKEQGVNAVTIGERILRVETAVTFLAARLL
ncbi:MAG: 16S rRNA (uracil(1498)-N(3))-methyltransferase [Desulfuromonas sp.]|nr:16S rRNA (uracil(1498)-N(3))-methyltransferase [Desulfuromonas sp.]